MFSWSFHHAEHIRLSKKEQDLKRALEMFLGGFFFFFNFISSNTEIYIMTKMLPVSMSSLLWSIVWI